VVKRNVVVNLATKKLLKHSYHFVRIIRTTHLLVSFFYLWTFITMRFLLASSFDQSHDLLITSMSLMILLIL
jgi:hypothetical protein